MPLSNEEKAHNADTFARWAARGLKGVTDLLEELSNSGHRFLPEEVQRMENVRVRLWGILRKQNMEGAK